MKTVPQYRVKADRETGEWLVNPLYVGEVIPSEWYDKIDTDKCHFDTYEAPLKDSLDTETRAIEVVWVD